MNKNDAEAVIKETIEYANREIEKHKKKTQKRVVGIAAGLVLLGIAGWGVFNFEIPVRYMENLVTVDVPEDEGLDIDIHLNNYKSAKAVLVKQTDNTYDLYVGVTQTLLTKVTKGEDKFLRVGNGILVDFGSDRLLGFMPEESDAEDIMRVYYIDNLTDEIMSMGDSELDNYENKTLVWTR